MNTNNELIFSIGEETRPKIDKIDDLETSFFHEVYKKAFKLVNEMLADFEKNKNKIKGDYYQESRNNIIGFVGERGSGKTSCLQSVYQCLTAETGEIFGYKYKDFLSLPTIDPSYFEASNNILEIIIANMFLAFKEDARKNPQSIVNSSGDDNAHYLQKKRELVKKFQIVKDTLDRINKKDTKVSNDSIEELSQLASGVNLKKQINELVEQYLNYFNKTTLIIAIDDMDLQTRHAFEMVEQIRKYLIIPNIIIFAGIKLVQLKDILKQNYYKEYELLIEKGLLSDSIENLVERYIAKLLPNNQQLHLPDLLDNLDRKIKIKNEGEKEEELIFDSIDEAVLHLIFRKTRYMFYNSNGNKNPIIPSNLRDLWGVLSLLYSMDNIPKDNNESIVYENRLKFQEYFIESWCYEHLDSNYYKFIQEIIEYDVSEVNKKVVDYLSVVCSKYGIKWDLRLTYYYNRPYNISLADVDYFLDRVGRIKHQPIIDNFVFALRTVYSMLLYKALENSKNQQSKREELKKKDRLYRFTDYEKLLGGELIQPENVFEKIIEEKPTPENTTSKSVSTKKTQKGSIKNIEKQNANEDDVNWHESKSLIMKKIMHHHTINKQELNKLWTSLITEKNTYDMESELEYDMRLNICSFFLLTTYSTTAHAHYRSSRFCYYTYYIADVFSDKYECVYSSFSALFNTCRYYHEYKDGNKRRQNVSMWNVLMKDNQTLFSKILYYNKIDSIGESEYRNKELEQVFIRNLEILDNLQDSLPYINNKLVVNNAEECINELINMYKKMSEYKFLIYPREKGGKSKIITFEVYTEICLFLEKIKQDRIAKETFFKIFKGN